MFFHFTFNKEGTYKFLAFRWIVIDYYSQEFNLKKIVIQFLIKHFWKMMAKTFHKGAIIKILYKANSIFSPCRAFTLIQIVKLIIFIRLSKLRNFRFTRAEILKKNYILSKEYPFTFVLKNVNYKSDSEIRRRLFFLNN